MPPTTEQPSHETPTLLLAFLADRDEPCPVCGYCLRALSAPRCPECGAPLELRVGSPQLRVGPWVLAIVSCALALGFDGVFATMMAVALAISPPGFWRPYGVAAAVALLAVAMLCAMLAIIRRRTAWARWPRRRQWITSGALFVVVGALHALVGIVLIQLID